MTRGIIRIWLGPLIDLSHIRIRRNKYIWNGRNIMSEYQEENTERIKTRREERRAKETEKIEEEFNGIGIC